MRTVNFTCDVYTNDSLHGVCFPTVFTMSSLLANMERVQSNQRTTGSVKAHLISWPRISVIFFTFLGTVPIPVQLGKIALVSLQLGKIAPLNLYENTGWKCHGPIPRAIKIFIPNLNWQLVAFLGASAFT